MECGSACLIEASTGKVLYDDIDINIPRKYVHTICELIRSEFPKKYYIEEPIYTKGYLSSFVQIHKNGAIFREFLAQDIEHCGIKIDNIYKNINKPIHLIN